MKFRSLGMYVAAGLTGWLSVAWWDGAYGLDSRPATSPSAPTYSSPSPGDAVAPLRALRSPAPGSAGLAGLAALIAALPPDSLDDAAAKIEKWPPGTAREFANALLHERREPSSPNDDPEPPANRFHDLVQLMTTGNILYGAYSSSSNDYATLADWVAMDPAAAIAAVLKMAPGGCRSPAVNTAADVLAKTDPAAAMEFVLKSGEQRLGAGAADAWAKLAIQNAPPAGATDAARQFLDHMTRAQQDSLFAALGVSEINDANANNDDPRRGSDLELVARCVLQARESTPGMESFFEELTEHPEAAEAVRRFIESSTNPSPAHQKALEILWAHQVKSAAFDGPDVAGLINGDLLDTSSGITDSHAALDRVATSVLPQLARSGRLPEALQVLDSISDPDIRRTSLEAVLPSWMEADPDAARAAFNAAPLTALERERWERHPAFLLHPQN